MPRKSSSAPSKRKVASSSPNHVYRQQGADSTWTGETGEYEAESILEVRIDEQGASSFLGSSLPIHPAPIPQPRTSRPSISYLIAIVAHSQVVPYQRLPFS